jgi:hypothetical protein
MPTTIPTTTSSTRPGSPSAGDAYFETDTKVYIIYDGANWRGYSSINLSGWSGSNTSSMSFDGVDDYLTTSSDISFAGDFSLSFWIKPTNNNDCWFTKTGDSSAFISSNSSGKIQINNGGVSTVGITTGEWNHILLSRSSSTITIYKKSDSGNDSSTITNSNTLSYNLLGTYYAAGFYHLGLMDEVAVFNTALSSTDATNIYNSGSPGDLSSYSSLIHWWRMGEAISGSTIFDSSNNSNNLTVHGPVVSNDVPV